jgi:hypothetical protein
METRPASSGIEDMETHKFSIGNPNRTRSTSYKIRIQFVHAPKIDGNVDSKSATRKHNEMEAPVGFKTWKALASSIGNQFQTQTQ